MRKFFSRLILSDRFSDVLAYLFGIIMIVGVVGTMMLASH